MGKERMRHAMTYAVILGVYLLIGFFVLKAAMHIPLMGVLFMIMGILVPFIVYFIQRKYRNDLLNGYITYFNAFSYAISLFFYSSLILGIGLFVYLQFINPDFISEFFNYTLTTLQQAGTVKPSTIDELLSMPLPGNADFVFNLIIMNIFSGFFISLFTSIFVRKEDFFNTGK